MLFWILQQIISVLLHDRYNVTVAMHIYFIYIKMNVGSYVLYRIVNYAFDHGMIFSIVLRMSPRRFLSWYKQLCPAVFPVVVLYN